MIAHARSRVRVANWAWREYRELLTSKHFDLGNKAAILKHKILPGLIYGFKTGSLSKKARDIVCREWNKFVRWSVRRFLFDHRNDTPTHVSNLEIYKKLGVQHKMC